MVLILKYSSPVKDKITVWARTINHREMRDSRSIFPLERTSITENKSFSQIKYFSLEKKVRGGENKLECNYLQVNHTSEQFGLSDKWKII